MVKSYIWVSGASAVGNKTFIRKLLQSPELREQFSIVGEAIPLGPGFRDPPEEKVTAEWVLAQKDAAGTIMIKWQSKSTDEIVRLARIALECEHREIFVRRSAEQMVQDLWNRDGKPDSATLTLEEEAQKWERWVKQTIKEARARVKDGIRLDIVDADDHQYIIAETVKTADIE